MTKNNIFMTWPLRCFICLVLIFNMVFIVPIGFTDEPQTEISLEEIYRLDGWYQDEYVYEQLTSNERVWFENYSGIDDLLLMHLSSQGYNLLESERIYAMKERFRINDPVLDQLFSGTDLDVLERNLSVIYSLLDSVTIPNVDYNSYYSLISEEQSIYKLRSAIMASLALNLDIGQIISTDNENEVNYQYIKAQT